MAHKTLIGGTSYEIGGGKTLVGGTGYSVDKGKTLVGGTAYDIGFSSGFTIDVYGYGGLHANGTFGGSYNNFALILIDGVSYAGSLYNNTKTFSLPAGTIITCVVGCQFNATAKVILNSQVVAQHTRTAGGFGVDYYVYYDYIVTKDVKITLSNEVGHEAYGSKYYCGIINIQE